MCWPAAFRPQATKVKGPMCFLLPFSPPPTSVFGSLNYDTGLYSLCCDAKTKTFQKRGKQKPIWEESAGPEWCEVAKNKDKPLGSLHHQLWTSDLYFTLLISIPLGLGICTMMMLAKHSGLQRLKIKSIHTSPFFLAWFLAAFFAKTHSWAISWSRTA